MRKDAKGCISLVHACMCVCTRLVFLSSFPRRRLLLIFTAIPSYPLPPLLSHPKYKKNNAPCNRRCCVTPAALQNKIKKFRIDRLTYIWWRGTHVADSGLFLASRFFLCCEHTVMCFSSSSFPAPVKVDARMPFLLDWQEFVFPPASTSDPLNGCCGVVCVYLYTGCACAPL